MWLRPPWPRNYRCFRLRAMKIRLTERRTVRYVQNRRKRFFDCGGDGFVCVQSRGTPHEDLAGVSGMTPVPLKGPKTGKMAIPPHDSGRRTPNVPRTLRFPFSRGMEG